ncbi:MAG: sigma-70 family RNA polymerase sigma factor [Planctomycetota bacterium]
MNQQSPEEKELIALARAGNETALSKLFDSHRERLKRMILLRMDRRIQPRVDASDVLQEAYVELASQLANYAKDPKLPFFLWLRRLTAQRLAKTHRFHLGQQKRDLARETRIDQRVSNDASSVYMASQLVGQFTSVAGRVLRREMQTKVQEVLETLPEADREIIALKHVEQMSHAEIATILEISENAATKRYIRSIRRLRSELARIPGMLD